MFRRSGKSSSILRASACGSSVRTRFATWRERWNWRWGARHRSFVSVGKRSCGDGRSAAAATTKDESARTIGSPLGHVLLETGKLPHPRAAKVDNPSEIAGFYRENASK